MTEQEKQIGGNFIAFSISGMIGLVTWFFWQVHPAFGILIFLVCIFGVGCVLAEID